MKLMCFHSALLRLEGKWEGLAKRRGFGKMPTARKGWHYPSFLGRGRKDFQVVMMLRVTWRKS